MDTPKAPPELSDAEIRRFLEEAPLYVETTFAKPRVNRASIEIDLVESYCHQCQRSRPFAQYVPRRVGAALTTGSIAMQFKCTDCKEATRTFVVFHEVTDKTVTLQKYGEYPRRPLPRSKALEKFLSEDSDLYEKAVVSLANGYGIGASAYFRRIVENNIDRLVSLVEADATASGDPEAAAALAKLHAGSPMSDRIEIANKALPGYLKPNGLNPLGRLYKVLSEGVHELSDAECLAQADAVSKCLEYMVSELASRSRHREEFVKTVGKI